MINEIVIVGFVIFVLLSIYEKLECSAIRGALVELAESGLKITLFLLLTNFSQSIFYHYHLGLCVGVI